MSILTSLILFTATTFTAMVSGVAGMGGGVMLLAILSLYYTHSTLVPVHGFIQLVSNSYRAFLLKKNIKKEILIPYIFGAPIGALCATLIFLTFPKHFIYLAIALIILYVVFKPKKLPALKIPFWSFGVLGVFSGFLSMIMGATGPLLAPFFLRDDLKKEEIVATKAATQLVSHAFKIPAFLYLGFDYQKNLLFLLFLTVGTIIGTTYGVKILKNIEAKIFQLIFKAFLLLAAARLIYKFINSIGV